MVIKQIYHLDRQSIISILYIQNSLNIQIEKRLFDMIYR